MTPANPQGALIAARPRICRAPRAYWQSVVSDNDSARDAIKLWFAPMSEGMTPYKAEILCDAENDAGKKLRAFMTNSHGARFEFTRSLGKRNVVISMKRLAATPGDAP